MTPRTPDETVPSWIRATAHPLASADPTAPLDDLRPLLRMVDERASIVGYGSGTRGAHEVFTLQLRIARLLVEAGGFRAVALDQAWGLCSRLDAYVRTGLGDPRALLLQAEPFSQTEEVLQLLEWMRDFNRTHPDDPVHLIGVSPHEVRDGDFDVVEAYLAKAAEPRSAELKALYAPLRPGRDVSDHGRSFHERDDRSQLVERARKAHELVASLPAGSAEHSWALHHARIIVQFHELHDHDDQPDDPHNMAYFERSFAENLIWWNRHTEAKTLFWSSSSHASNGRNRAISFPPHPARASRNAGSLLRERLGDEYVSIGLTFDEGELPGFDPATPHRVPAAQPPLAESILTAAGDAYLLDVHAPAPPEVRRWLDGTTILRAIGPNYDPAIDTAHQLTGGSLTEWFDVLIHHRHVTPARPLGR